MRPRWGRRGIVSAVLALLLAGTLAHGGELVRERFEDVAPSARSGQVPGRDGGGWTQSETAFFMVPPIYLEHPVAIADGRRGSISFDLQRTAVAVEDERTVFALHDAAGQILFRIKLRWGTPFNDDLPLLRLRGRAFVEQGLGLWSTEILLDREVAAGQWAHFDLTWDDAAGRYGLYVDGRAQEVDPHRYVLATGERLPDQRPELNAIYAARGEPQRFTSRPFRDLLRRAETLRLGANYITGSERASSPLANAVLDNFVLVVDEAVELVSKLHREGYDVKDLAGVHTPEGIELTWGPPEIRAVNQGYLIYRRDGEEGNARFEKLTAERVYDLTYLDATAQPGESYRYSVTAVYADGRGRDLESQYPPEVTVTAAALSVASVAAEKTSYGANQEIVVTLRGTLDATATFTIQDIAADQPMEEIDDGVYVGKVTVPSDLNLAAAALSATLTDAAGETATATGTALAIDSDPPAAIGRILATAPWGGEVELAWDASPSADVAHYLVYRGEDTPPYTLADAYETVKGLELVDRGVVAGIEYYYVVVPVDTAGNKGPESPQAWATAVAGDGPEIAAVSVTPFGKPAKPGETLTLTVTGQSGASVAVEVGALTHVPLTEQGRSGTYTGTYAVQEGDVGATKTLHRLIARMSDPYGASALAGPELALVGLDALNDTTPPVIAAAEHDGWQVAGFSGKLVAGDVLTVTLEGEPGAYGSFAIPGVVAGVAMDEVTPGSYAGSYTIGWGDGGTDLPVLAQLADDAGNEAGVPTGRTISLDTRVRLSVTARETLLPADKKATTRLTAKATDANGGDVADHELAITLSTTEEYTGVVGGGRIEDREARMEDEDNVEVKWGGSTDAFGEVAATYTAGHAAKTALLIAKDLTTGDAGAGWLNTYVSATVAIQLTPRTRRGIADQAILQLSVDPPKLTADGRSTARLRARLTDLSGKNPIAGAKIAFSLGNENGRLKIFDRETDDKGLAEAEYRAGTAIGTVTVTASAARYGVTASVQIILMADAPAKIDLVADATELPADGKSEATLSIQVTDIHDNPNAQVPVTFSVLKGSGDVSEPEILTDRNGEGEVTFTAGTKPATTVIEARHTSRAPTEEELRRVYGTVFVPRLHERQERDRIKLEQWLVEPEDEVEQGQELAVLASRRGSWTLTAPAKGTFVRRVKYERDRVELGETLGYVEIDPEVWEKEYVE